MTYKVIVHQNLKYSDNLIGTFDDLAEAQQFIEVVLKHFDKTDISIEIVRSEEETEE